MGVVLFGCVASAARGQFWQVRSQHFPYLQYGDDIRFGAALALGNFDGGPHADLVVGAPGFRGAGTEPVGAVRFYLGTSYGIFDDGGLTDLALDGSAQGLGAAVATGDFDGDGRDEVAIGAPLAASTAWPPVPGAGAVWVARRGVDGTWSTDRLPSFLAADDGFGEILAVGDFNDDGYDDLVVGAPARDTGGILDSGRIEVFYGSADGLDLHEAKTLGGATANDRFGAALATGDFDSDGYDDLAVGIPGYDAGGQTSAGAVMVLFGTATAVDGRDRPLLTDSTFAGGAAESGARFGAALAAGDFNRALLCLPGTCHDDLAIGSPAALPYPSDAGKVRVAYGGAGGLQTAGSLVLFQDGVGGAIEEGDAFGAVLVAGRAGKAGLSADDLLIAATGESDHHAGEGWIDLVYGAAGGLGNGLPPQALHQDAGLSGGGCTQGEGWGSVMALGDIDGDGWTDLAVGLPARPYDGSPNAGIVQILFGAQFADGIENGDLGMWSTQLP
jgi:hypothetical protein